MNKEYIIIEEAEVKELLDMSLAIKAIRQCFEAKARGEFFAHPKVNIKGHHGDLRITPGESLSNPAIIGFRLYDVIRDDFKDQAQMTVVYDNQSGRMKGIVMSQLLGVYRTAAFNAVMQEGMSKKQVNELGIVGTGLQAEYHLKAYLEVLNPGKIKVYGRTPKNALAFVERMQVEIEREIVLCDSLEMLREVDALILTTRSQESLFAPHFFKKGITITSIGPKIKGHSELSNEFAATFPIIITDSIEQVNTYGDRFFIEDRSRIIDFAEVLNHPEKGRINDEQQILLCSVGMGGTEVALANAIIEKKLSAIY